MASFFHLNIVFNNDSILEADRKAARLSVSHHALDVAKEIREFLPPASADELLPSTVDALWLKYGSSPDSAYKLQAKLNHAAFKKQSEDSLCHTPSFISCSHPTANLLLTTTPDEEGLMLTNSQFIAAANHRLSASVPLKKNLRCSCFPSKQLTDSQHAFSCLLLRKKGSFNRHENIVRTLEDCARSAGAVTSTKAPEDLNRSDKEKELVPDLFIDTGNVKYMIDVSVTYPGASSYSKQASKEQGAAAARREKEKTDKYEKLAFRNGYIFVPFVFESYGMLGSHADKFLRDLCHSSISNHFINQLQYFKRRLIIALYRGNARVAHEGVKLLSFFFY
jgi:hypothetical protein